MRREKRLDRRVKSSFYAAIKHLFFTLSDSIWILLSRQHKFWPRWMILDPQNLPLSHDCRYKGDNKMTILKECLKIYLNKWFSGLEECLRWTELLSEPNQWYLCEIFSWILVEERIWQRGHMPEISITHVPEWTFVSSDSISLKMQIILRCFVHFYLACNVNINSIISQAWEGANFHVKWCCCCVNTVYMCLCVHNTVCVGCAESCEALSCLPWCVWFPCCGAGITPGISRILAEPIDGTEMTAPIMQSPASTPHYSGLKATQTADYARTAAGGKSHTTD